MKEELNEKANDNKINVEDIVELSLSRNPDVVDVLKEIKEKLQWPNEAIEYKNGNIVPPLGAWVDVGCEYIANGCEGLINYSKNINNANFAISILQENKNSKSVESLLKIAEFYSDDMQSHKYILIKIVTALNLILSFKDSPEVEVTIIENVRSLIHKIIGLCENSAEYASTICALRGVGNEESIKLVSTIPKLEGAWSGTERIVTQAIKQRIKNS
ncbi:hypothetical protein [Endozoicomonas ascidiicola]|uniref:hypothetical protein n=1 Tax=Endozoicomonas ascidiicola TaxID=1698521 RepID=UPI000833CC6A|nr:hypothetical protein [Endozoicomonas ascidiicola]